MPAPDLAVESLSDAVCCRVGYAPDPWSWTDWIYGPFTGRWDDPDTAYRVLYAASSEFACFVELLARFRKDPVVTAGMQEIVSNDARDADHPTVSGGVVPSEWFDPRCVATGRITGEYVDVQHADSISHLRPHFVLLARSLGLSDFDGAAIRSSEPRTLTQRVSRHLYVRTAPQFDGVLFESRLGNDITLIGIFERRDTSTGTRSRLIDPVDVIAIDPESPDFQRALEVLDLEVG